MAVTVSTEWLGEYAPNDMKPKDLADHLSSIGLAVDDVEDLGGGDARLGLDLTADRGDCWSVIGVAREIAASQGRELSMPSLELAEGGDDVASSFAVEVEDGVGCPRYTARIVRGVKIGPSPDWMQRRLEAVGIRPISNVVDITNYVMYEMGQPLHAFDLSLLKGGKIVVRRARAGETMKLIDESEKKLTADDLVIADGETPVALAGVMGGADTEIRDSTTDVLLESAQFDIVSVRRTSRVHGVSTESSIRFEHGVDPVGVEAASRRAAHLFCELAGGTVAPGVIDTNPDVYKPQEIMLRHSRLPRLLGADVPQLEAIRILEALGLTLSREDGETTWWLAPSWRPDLTVEVDLIEEVARIYGYERLGGSSTMRVFPVTPHPVFEMRRSVRDILTGLGYSEALGASFFSTGEATFGGGEAYRVMNPVRAGEDALRTSLVPSLLAAKVANQNRGRRRVRLFEVGPVCLPGTELAVERLAIIDDGVEADDYIGVKGDDSPERVMLRAKGALDVLVARLGGGARMALEPASGDVATRLSDAMTISFDGVVVGTMGLLAASRADAKDIKSRPAIIEIDPAVIVERGGRITAARPLPVYPGIARDTALVLDEGVSWDDLVASATSEGASHEWRRMEELALLDVYRGKQLGNGKKSIAFRVVYRAEDRTLADEDVKEPHDSFVQMLCKELRAEVRA
jgi:phenylalanyl-tRNA synthetase beta chain